MSEQDQIRLRDGEVVLYKRPNSNRWQVKYKLPDSTWVRTSTKRTNRAEAERIAGDLYDSARFLTKAGINPISRRFRDVAKLTRKNLEEAVNVGKGKSAYRDYIQAIDKYLIPFFGSTLVDKIDANELQKFGTWRSQQFKKPPAASTIANHSAALRRVFDTAVEQGWVLTKNIPELPNDGKKAVRRPDFSQAEWEKLNAGLKPWISQTKIKRSQQVREVLRWYVPFLVFSGVRPGSEALNLKWQHLSWDQTQGAKQRTLLMSLDGKTGRRSAVASNECVRVFERLHKMSANLAELDFDTLLEQRTDQYVFQTRDGTVPTDLGSAFDDLLVSLGLKFDHHGESRTLYSLRHTYATSRLKEGVPIHTLAKQMGTSVTMIEQHYSHLTPLLAAKHFRGKADPKNGR